MVSAGPPVKPSLPPEMPDPSRFWRGIDAGLADRWLIGSRPSLFLLPGDRMHLVVPILLLLLRKARLGAHCGSSHSEVQLRLHKPKIKEFVQLTDWELSLNPTELMEVHRPRRLLRA